MDTVVSDTESNYAHPKRGRGVNEDTGGITGGGRFVGSLVDSGKAVVIGITIGVEVVAKGREDNGDGG